MFLFLKVSKDIPSMSLSRYQNRLCGKYFHLCVAPLYEMCMQNYLNEWKGALSIGIDNLNKYVTVYPLSNITPLFTEYTHFHLRQ